MKTIEEKETLRLIKKYHVMANQSGMDSEERKEFLKMLTGKTSSKDCSYLQIMFVCKELEKIINPKVKQADYWRKRVLSACGRYVKALGNANHNNANYVKAIICRSAKVKAEDFNRIPVNKLQALYNSFNYMARTMKKVMDDAEEIINNNIKNN